MLTKLKVRNFNRIERATGNRQPSRCRKCYNSYRDGNCDKIRFKLTRDKIKHVIRLRLSIKEFITLPSNPTSTGLESALAKAIKSSNFVTVATLMTSLRFGQSKSLKLSETFQLFGPNLILTWPNWTWTCDERQKCPTPSTTWLSMPYICIITISFSDHHHSFTNHDALTHAWRLNLLEPIWISPVTPYTTATIIFSSLSSSRRSELQKNSGVWDYDDATVLFDNPLFDSPKHPPPLIHLWGESDCERPMTYPALRVPYPLRWHQNNKKVFCPTTATYLITTRTSPSTCLWVFGTCNIPEPGLTAILNLNVS